MDPHSAMYRKMGLQEITEQTIAECLDEIPISVDRAFITSFILNGQRIVNDIIFTDTMTEEESSFNLTM